jgi:hypothetical protein
MHSTPKKFRSPRDVWRELWPLLLVLFGCSSFDPSAALPTGAEPMVAPAAYQDWWEKTEACAERLGRFSRIQWYEVPGVATFATDMGPKVGLWIQNGSSVLIVVAGHYENHEMVVRHEMLHALLGQEGHPPEYFVNRCHLTWESWNGGR